MSNLDQSDKPTQPKPGPTSLDEIPVEELIRLTRAFTRRITDEDRQRLSVELRESGHQRTIQLSAPLTLQQFFAGEIDLDNELSRRFLNAPLLSHIRFAPLPGEPVQRQATAILASQDDSTLVNVDASVGEKATRVDFTFTLFSTLGLRFPLASLTRSDRRRWLDLMRRDNGIAFLWTLSRWEQPYLIFVVREAFARVYAFSPQGYEAAARLTPDMVTSLVDWLEGLWFPDASAARQVAVQEEAPVAARWDEPPTLVGRPTREPAGAEATVPDAPEEQWNDAPAWEASDADASAEDGASQLEW